ncbi:hypothetical protein ABK040_010027 [Willaertia magna]
MTSQVVREEFETSVTIDDNKIKGIIRESINTVLKDVQYSTKVDTWISTIIEGILKGLQNNQEQMLLPDNNGKVTGKPYKYVVTCIIMQRTGAGLQSSCIAHWEGQSTDQMISEYWFNDTIHCVATVFAVRV